VGVAQRTFRPGFDGVDAPFGFPPEEFVDPAAADSVAAGSVRDRQALVTDCEDNDFLLEPVKFFV
jgi:hypothetical protein